MTSDIDAGIADGVQTIRFARPAKKNALTEAMYGALADAIERGNRDSAVLANVILGSKGVFCAGNDIGDFLKTAIGTGGKGREVFRFLSALARVAKPLIAGVDGVAVGIGTTMLFHCDLVYATPAAQFSTPFVDLGIVPEAASSLLMPARMGHARAFEMLGMGAVFDAERMCAAGLVNAIVPSSELEAKAQGAARALAQKSPEALAMTRLLMRPDPAEIQKRIDIEAAAFSERLKSPEARKAFEAFLSKRGDA